jgi:hypothetical protein
MTLKKAILKIISKMLPLSAYKQLVNFHILAVKYGQFKTINRRACVNSDGDRIPWYTYPAIEYLNNIDFSQKIVFEYGSGNSSAYWASKAKRVFSIEHDKDWYDKIKNDLAENQSIDLSENENGYLEAINNISDKIDVIIIDGIHREKCAKLVKDHISDSGIVILDNADWHKETSRYLREELDLIEVDFHGFGPINAYTWTTSIFFTRNARLRPVDNIQPHYSISAIENGDNEEFN